MRKPSDAVSVIVVVPRLVAPAVLMVTVRFEPEPPSTTPAAGTTAVFDELADIDTAVPSGSVTVKASGPDETPEPASKSVWFDGTVPNTGAWLAPTVIATVAAGLNNAPSEARYVKLSPPLKPAVGV